MCQIWAGMSSFFQESCKPYGELKAEVTCAWLSTYIHRDHGWVWCDVMWCWRGWGGGWERQSEGLLMCTHTHLYNEDFLREQVSPLRLVRHRYNEKIVVKHESVAPFSAIISISVDSNLVKVKDGWMNKQYHIGGAQSRISFKVFPQMFHEAAPAETQLYLSLCVLFFSPPIKNYTLEHFFIIGWGKKILNG